MFNVLQMFFMFYFRLFVICTCMYLLRVLYMYSENEKDEKRKLQSEKGTRGKAVQK